MVSGPLILRQTLVMNFVLRGKSAAVHVRYATKPKNAVLCRIFYIDPRPGAMFVFRVFEFATKTSVLLRVQAVTSKAVEW